MLRYYQFRTILLLSVGYLMICVARKALSVTMPLLLAHNEGKTSFLSETDIGSISTAFSASYGLSKFVGGVLADFLSCSSLFALGLALAGGCNVLFAIVEDKHLLVYIWGLNGLLQGVGWPALSTILLNWFPPKNRGTAWSICTAAGM